MSSSLTKTFKLRVSTMLMRIIKIHFYKKSYDPCSKKLTFSDRLNLRYTFLIHERPVKKTRFRRCYTRPAPRERTWTSASSDALGSKRWNVSPGDSDGRRCIDSGRDSDPWAKRVARNALGVPVANRIRFIVYTCWRAEQQCRVICPGAGYSSHGISLRVGANGAVNWEFYGTLNAPGDRSFRACCAR